MSYVVKAESAADAVKPPTYYEVPDLEVIFKTREVRSDKPEEHYHLSPAKTTDDTCPLVEEVDLSTSPSHSATSTSFASPSSWESDGDRAFQINVHDIHGTTAEVHDLGTVSGLAEESTFVVIADSSLASHTTVPSAPLLTSELTGEASSAVTTTAIVTTIVATSASSSLSSSSPHFATVAIDLLPVAPISSPTHHSPPPSIGGGEDLVEADHDSADDLVQGFASDSEESENDMESKPNCNISPPTFRGLTTENPRDWVRYLENYASYKGFDGAKTLALFKVLLVDSAALWLDSLPVATTASWDALKAAFETRYNPPGFMKYKYANDFFSMKQEKSTVDDFCARMLKIAKELNADDAMLCYAVTNGLNPEIRNHVTRNQPTNWTDLVHHAKIGEMCVPVSSQTDETLSVKLELIQDQLKELTAEKAQSSRVVSPVGRRPGSSPERRVRFEDDAARPDRKTDRGLRFDDFRNPNDRRYDESGSRFGERSTSPYSRSQWGLRGGSGGYRGNGSAPLRRQWRNNEFRGGTFRGRGIPRGRGRPIRGEGAAARQWLDFNPDICGKCGLRPHDHPNMCPAINQFCRACNRKGHYQRVCRTTARAQARMD